MLSGYLPEMLFCRLRCLQEMLALVALTQSRKSTCLMNRFPAALRLSHVRSLERLLGLRCRSSFSCCAEIQLQRADTEFNKNVMLLIPPPKLRSDIAEGMAEEIFRHASYPLCSELDTFCWHKC